MLSNLLATSFESPEIQLFRAIETHDRESVLLLLQNQVPLNTVDEKDGLNPLKKAIHYHFHECLPWLIAYGAQFGETITNQEDSYTLSTPLHYAAYVDDPQSLCLFLSPSLSIDTQDSEGKTPLHIAAYEGYLNTISALLERGARFDLIDHQGRTSLHAAATLHTQDQPLCLLELVKAGARLDQTDHYGNTALHLAAQLSLQVNLATLLVSGANPNAQNKRGQTPLMQMIEENQDTDAILACIELLIAYDADLDLQDHSGNTVMDKALLNPHVDSRIKNRLLDLNAQSGIELLRDEIECETESFNRIMPRSTAGRQSSC